MIKKGILFFILASIFISSCKTDVEEKRRNTGFQKNKKEVASKKDTVTEHPVYYRFPSAKEMFSYLQGKDLRYQTDLTNPVANLEKYHSTRSKTLNLGVYLADISYMTLFDKTQNIDRYFNAVFNLSADLRIKAPHEERLLQKISDNMHNADSLVEIADRYHSDIIDYLLKTGNEKTLAVITTGSYIEGLYLASNLVSDYTKNEPTVNKIADQKHAFINLTKFARDFSEDINTRYSIKYLEKINKHFENLTVIEDDTNIERENDSTMVFGGGDKIDISQSDFNALKKEVTTIRNEIVTNSKIAENE